MEEIKIPKEYISPPKEEGPLKEPYDMPAEFMVSAEPREATSKEFSGKSGGEESQRAGLHGLLKRMMLFPVASAIATVSIVFSSLGYDPLGEDFLNQEGYGQESSLFEDEEPGGESGSPSGNRGNGEGESNVGGEKRQVREYPGDITGVRIEVTYVPTGDSYRAQANGEEGLEEARSWVRELGGDPDTLSYVRSEMIYLGYEASEDAIIVGDPDDIENAYVAQGTLTRNYGELAYFEAFESMEVSEPDISVIEGLPISVLFVPTQETYYPEQTGRAGIQEAREWLRSIGADPDSLAFVTIRRETKYEVNDGVLSTILTDFAHYEATEYAEGYTDTEVFPELPNMEPDFAGNYAWGGMGSEEYLRIFMSDKTTLYLEAGGYWRDNEGAVESSLPSCRYDRETNTLTLKDFNDPEAVLDANLMGNGFKIRLEGDNHIGSIQVWGAMYGGSVAFVGDGNLTIGEVHPNSGTGILLNAEGSESCVMIGANVFMEIQGEHQIAVYDTQAENPVIMNGSMHVIGGEIYSGEMQYNDSVNAYVHDCEVRDNIGDHWIMLAT